MPAIVIFLIALVVIAAAVFAAANLRTVARIKRERSQVRQMEKEENVFISRRALKALHHNLAEDETQILWADRRHWLTAWDILALGAAAALLLIFSVVGAVWTPRFTLTSINGAKQHYTIHYLWVPPLFLAFAAIGVGWTRWLGWSAEYRLLNNRRLMLVHQPWAWAFWLWNSEKNDPLPLEAVTAVETKSTYWGRLFGYGSVIVKSLLQDTEDEEFHEITYTRRYKEFKEVLDEAVKEARSHIVAVAGSIVPVDDAAAR